MEKMKKDQLLITQQPDGTKKMCKWQVHNEEK